MTSQNYPNWMKATPTPEYRKLNGVGMTGWLGYVSVSDITYWNDNRRTDAQIARWRERNRRVPTNEELYDYFEGDPDLEIPLFAENIILNGLRQPIILSYDKILLDGNRRYLAHRWILKNGTPQQRSEFSKILAWVLEEKDSDDQGKLRVVTEYNFLDDFRREWSDFVKAKLLYEQSVDNGYSIPELADMYGGPGFSKSKIREFIRTYEIIDLYAEFSKDYNSALATAEDKFIWFQQLQRSYSDIIRSDDEFQETVFDSIRKGYVGTTDDLKNLRDVRKYPDAWGLFKQGDIRGAHLIRSNRKFEEDRAMAPDRRMAEINSNLEVLLGESDMVERISPVARARFQELAEQIPGQVQNVDLRVAYLVQKLRSISSEELASLSDDMLDELKMALDRVIRQATATRS